MNLTERKAQISDFYIQFRNLIKVAPDAETKKDLNIALKRYADRHCLPMVQKKKVIIALLESGLVTRMELEEATGYRTEIIVNILKKLTEDKIVQAVIYPMSGRGRPTKKYFLID